jgi:putative quinone oxidoreductase, YhdH/YhfP family
MTAHQFRCLLVQKDSQGQSQLQLVERPRDELPPGDVLIRVRYSSLNYKDAMAATGNPAIAKSLPHIPGIDAAGIVLESNSPRFQPGDEVLATGHEFGVERWGGWSELMTARSEWLVPRPEGLSLLDAMSLGTAGFTAAQCVQALIHHKVTPERGEVVVSGATGGVGIISVMLLAQLGYRVVAVTGKQDQAEWLKSLGATEVAGRELLSEERPRPLLTARFAGGIDTVGGNVLMTMCKVIQHRGCVACCGVAGGAELPLTVYPFILRGLTLSGIDSAWCPDDERADIWKRLASDWKLDKLSECRTVVTLDQLPDFVPRILQGENIGRVVVDLTA